jgi:thiol-disulfide isomerase/thioredoxin
MKSWSLLIAAILAPLLGFCGATGAPSPAPQVRETLDSAPATPYDQSADAQTAVAAAITRAAATHKFVLIDFGGNWCPDCRVTAGVLALGEVKPWVDKTFEVVMVDVGRMNRNLDIASRFGVKIRAVPTIIILDDQGHVLNSGNPAALSDARSMPPQAIVDTLNGWIQKPG